VVVLLDELQAISNLTECGTVLGVVLPAIEHQLVDRVVAVLRLWQAASFTQLLERESGRQGAVGKYLPHNDTERPAVRERERERDKSKSQMYTCNTLCWCACVGMAIYQTSEAAV